MKLFAKYQFHLTSIGIITIVIGFLFYKPLTAEYTFLGPDSLSPSAVHQGITTAEEENGESPLWLPWIFSGMPSVHSFQNISDYYFPNYIIHLLKSMGIPGFWNYIFHFILAGMGIFSILRKLGTDCYSALFGGLSYVLMPYLITMVVHGHGSQMMTTAWLPWIIWAILRLYDDVSIKKLGFLALIVGLQMQRAHVQIAYYSWLAAGLLIIMLLFRIYGKPNNSPKWMIYVGFAFILGLCMAMWIYIPALNYAPYSIRGAGGTAFDYATAWSFSIGEMATFFIPSFYGFGGATYWGNMPFTDYPNYMGIIVLTLAVIGTLFHEGKIKWYFVISAFLALLISFGENFFLYQVCYDYLPYFNKFRVPTMFLILTQFSVSILAGLGLEFISNELIKNKTNTSLKKIAGVLLSIIVILLFIKLFCIPKLGYFPKYPQNNLPAEVKINFDMLRLEMINRDLMTVMLLLIVSSIIVYIARLGWSTHRGLAGIIIALSIVDITLVDRKIIEPGRDSYRQSTISKTSLKSTYLTKDEVIRFLQKDTTRYRILPLGSLANENRWSAFQIESIEGYHPAKLFRYNQVKNEVGWNSLGILKMLNVKYIISQEALPHPAFELVFSGKHFHRGNFQNTNVYQFKYYTPRAFFVEKLQTMSNNDLQLQALRKSGFNPLILSFVEHELQDFEYSDDAEVEIVYWTPDKIEFQLKVPSRQFMVLSEIYYPRGWKITSHPEWEIHPVNIILRGVYIPAGSYRMVMEYIPMDIFFGSILTWGSTAVILMLIFSGIYIDIRNDAT